MRVSGWRLLGEPLTDKPGRFPFNIQWRQYILMQPEIWGWDLSLKTPSPSRLKGMPVLSRRNWKRWISPSVSPTQQGGIGLGNVFCIILLCMCSPQAHAQLVRATCFAAHTERQENREGRHLQFYYYFNGFLYHSGIALSNALGP